MFDRAQCRRDLALPGQVDATRIYNKCQQDRTTSFQHSECSVQVMQKREESVKTFLTPGVVRGARLSLLGSNRRPRIMDVARRHLHRGGELDMARHRLVHVIKNEKEREASPRARRHEKWHALPAGHDPATGKSTEDGGPWAIPERTPRLAKGSPSSARPLRTRTISRDHSISRNRNQRLRRPQNAG